MAKDQKSNRTAELLEKVNAAHDWEGGQVYGGSGTQLSSTDTCRVCGLERQRFSDSQNGVDVRFTFQDSKGTKLTLREAAELKC
jgi:hypothetical protein